jgi:hypothetical protein
VQLGKMGSLTSAASMDSKIPSEPSRTSEPSRSRRQLPTKGACEGRPTKGECQHAQPALALFSIAPGMLFKLPWHHLAEAHSRIVPLRRKLLGAKFGQSFPMPKHGREQSDERQKGYFARLLDVPYNRLKMLPHLGPELPSPLESFFSKGRFCCELLPGRIGGLLKAGTFHFHSLTCAVTPDAR